MHHACAERNLGLIRLFSQYGLSLNSPRDEVYVVQYIKHISGFSAVSQAKQIMYPITFNSIQNGETPLDILKNRAYDKGSISSAKKRADCLKALNVTIISHNYNWSLFYLNMLVDT